VYGLQFSLYTDSVKASRWGLTNVCAKCQLFLYIWDCSIYCESYHTKRKTLHKGGETQQMSTTNDN